MAKRVKKEVKLYALIGALIILALVFGVQSLAVKPSANEPQVIVYNENNYQAPNVTVYTLVNVTVTQAQNTTQNTTPDANGSVYGFGIGNSPQDHAQAIADNMTTGTPTTTTTPATTTITPTTPTTTTNPASAQPSGSTVTYKDAVSAKGIETHTVIYTAKNADGSTTTTTYQTRSDGANSITTKTKAP